MAVEIRELSGEDLPAALELWQQTGDMAAAMIDTPQGLASFLKSNHGLSLVAVEAGVIVGVLLCGHEGGSGRRFHLALAATHRDTDLSQRLLGMASRKLAARGLRACRLTLAGSDEQGGRDFWRSIHWSRGDSWTPSRVLSGDDALDRVLGCVDAHTQRSAATPTVA